MNILDKYHAANVVLRDALSQALPLVMGRTSTPSGVADVVSKIREALASTEPISNLSPGDFGSSSASAISESIISSAEMMIASDALNTLNYLRPGLVHFLVDNGILSQSVVVDVVRSRNIHQTEYSLLVNILSDIIDRDHDANVQKYLSYILQSASSWVWTNRQRPETDTKRWVMAVQILKRAMENGGDLFTATGASEGWFDSFSAAAEKFMSDFSSKFAAEVDQVVEIDSTTHSMAAPQNNVYGLDPSINSYNYIKHYIIY